MGGLGIWFNNQTDALYCNYADEGYGESWYILDRFFGIGTLPVSPPTPENRLRHLLIRGGNDDFNFMDTCDAEWFDKIGRPELILFINTPDEDSDDFINEIRYGVAETEELRDLVAYEDDGEKH